MWAGVTIVNFSSAITAISCLLIFHPLVFLPCMHSYTHIYLHLHELCLLYFIRFLFFSRFVWAHRYRNQISFCFIWFLIFFFLLGLLVQSFFFHFSVSHAPTLPICRSESRFMKLNLYYRIILLKSHAVISKFISPAPYFFHIFFLLSFNGIGFLFSFFLLIYCHKWLFFAIGTLKCTDQMMQKLAHIQIKFIKSIFCILQNPIMAVC